MINLNQFKTTQQDAIELFHKGTLALADVENNGIRIDTEKLTNTIKEVDEKIQSLQNELKTSKEFKKWKKVFREKTNLGSKQQLAHIIYKVLGHECHYYTEPSESHPKGQPKADEHSLAHINLPFLKKYFENEKLKKVKGTYLEGIFHETVDGYLHGFQNLHLSKSFRSTGSLPNLHNFPIRNKMIGKMVRSCCLPHSGHHWVEADFSGIEVRISQVYNSDPQLRKYLLDPTTDMHRDMAMQCYLIATPDEVSKDSRYCAKNKYVFPQFYGSFYVDCARSLWEAIDLMSLKTEKTQVPLKEHLKKKGIHSLGRCDEKQQPVRGTFEYHIQQVEKDFWGRRFQVYNQWRKDWFNFYLKNGWFPSHTGFRYSGVYRRNQVTNLAIQGSAFHCELWSTTEMNQWLKKHKMKSKIINQIHDSINLSVHPRELQDVCFKLEEIMTKKLLEHWKWISIPMSIEIEVSPVDASWFDKAVYEVREGKWQLKPKK